MSDAQSGITFSEPAVDKIADTLVANNQANLDFVSQCLARGEALVEKLMTAKAADDQAEAERYALKSQAADEQRALDHQLEMERIASTERTATIALCQSLLHTVEYSEDAAVKNAAVTTATALLSSLLGVEAAADSDDSDDITAVEA